MVLMPLLSRLVTLLVIWTMPIFLARLTLIPIKSWSCCFRVVFFQAEDGIRDLTVTGVQTCALPICLPRTQDGYQNTVINEFLFHCAGGRQPAVVDQAALRDHFSHTRSKQTQLHIEIGRASCRERV